MNNNGNMECQFCGDKTSSRYYYDKEKRLLCNKHYQQYVKHGKCQDRNRLTKNDFLKIDDFTSYMLLYDTHGIETGRTIIDNSIIDEINHIKWYKRVNRNTSYCYGKLNGKTIMLHRFITNPLETNVIDHIDGDGLNNLKGNLRECSKRENSMNMHKEKVIGVNYDNSRKKYIANIMVNGKNIFLGRFDLFEDAVEKRLEAEKIYFGEFSSQNK